jgi:paraquat-inducible protein A
MPPIPNPTTSSDDGPPADAPMPPRELVECPDCGLLQTLPPTVPGHSPHCSRCRASFGRRWRPGDAALAFSITALVLFLLANVSPLMGIDISGRGQSVRLGSGVVGLADHGFTPLAVFVLFISILAPLIRVVALGYVLFQVRRRQIPGHLALILRLADRLRPWCMLDVFLIGALVALTKLHSLAEVNIGIGFWALGLLVVTLAGFEMIIDRHMLWAALASPPTPPDMLDRHACIGCRTCGFVQPVALRCLRCGDRLLRRKPESLHRTAALVITGFVLYLPANLYAVVTVVSFGRATSATILGGVIELMNGSDWPLALIVFAASVAVPLLKLIGLSWLLLSTRLGSRRRLADRTRLYRLIDLVSRWSAVDICVAALLTALVTLGNLATIVPGLGALAFGAVVVVTMLATEYFDPRLMWDAAGANDA